MATSLCSLWFSVSVNIHGISVKQYVQFQWSVNINDGYWHIGLRANSEWQWHQSGNKTVTADVDSIPWQNGTIPTNANEKCAVYHNGNIIAVDCAVKKYHYLCQYGIK